MEAKDLKKEYLNGNPRVERFDNIFTFMQFCYINKLTEENSVTWYDEEKGLMYIARK
mgnify:FL=1